MKDSATHAAIEAVARHSSYGRLIAYLASRAHDVAGAEDALSDAFAAALERWPLDGIPQKREAWLLHAARIASAFLVSPAAMRQRLVRAKAKIRDAAIPFRVPGPREWDERVSFVLDAIYSAYTTGWESLMETGSTHHALAEEATAIGRTLIQLMPAEPEAHGLLALMLHCEARRAARYTSGGRFVPLDQQDTTLWSRPLMAEAESHLRSAAAFKRMGRYQLEAAIQSIHASRASTGNIDWREILLFYEGLVQIAPGIGSLVGRAVALAQAVEPAAGFAALEEVPAGRVEGYQPYWAARGHLLQLLNRRNEAHQAFARAASLTDDPALREYVPRTFLEKILV